MAGGQERILRRRIKSVQSTKKITRAMELIAASRIVKAQARVQAAQPYADGITEVVRDLQAAGAGANNPLLVPRAETRRVGEVVLAADRGLCGAYNTTRHPRRRERHPRATGAGPRDRDRHVGRKPEGYFRFRNYPDRRRRSAGSRRTPTYEDARAVAAAVDPARSRTATLDLVQLTYTKFISAGRQEVVIEPLLPLPRGSRATRRPRRPSPASRRRGVRVRARARSHPRRAAAALRRSAHLRRAAQRRRVGARGPPARDEGRDRQRRRADPGAEPGDEPRPPGRDHDRDHGDRRRRRSAASRRRRPTSSTSVSISAACGPPSPPATPAH